MKKEQVVKVLYVVVLSLLLFLFVSPFLIPLFFAATVSLTLVPLLHYLVGKGMHKKRAAALLTALFGIVISIPLFFFAIKGTLAVVNKLEQPTFSQKLQGQNVTEIVSDFRHDIVIMVQKFTRRYDFLDFLNEKKINEYMKIANTYVLKFFKSFAGNIPTLFIFLLIMILCTYSFLTHSEGIRKFFQQLTGFNDKRMDELTTIFVQDSRQVYLSNIATGTVQSLIVASTVKLLGVGGFFVVFFITLILSFIPVIGAAPVAFIFALTAFFGDNTTAAIILVVVGGFTGVVDNLMRPWLTTFGESKIPPIVAFVSVIGGALLLGFPGLFIGLLVGSIAYDTLPIFWEELNPKK